MQEATVLRKYQIERREIEKVAGVRQIGEKTSVKKKTRHPQSAGIRINENTDHCFSFANPSHQTSNIQSMHLGTSGVRRSPVARHVHYFGSIPIKGRRVG